jgi:Flp pilus assembly pilin Flp
MKDSDRPYFMRTAICPLPRTPAGRRNRRRGQTLVEYTLILAVITVVMISVMSLLGSRIVVVFSAMTAILDTAQNSH